MARPALMGRFTEFLGEAGRRRVWRTVLAYAAVVFVLLQLGEIILPAFGAPAWAMRILVVVCFLGFPLVVALAWVFDITSSGIQRVRSGADFRDTSGYSGTTLPRLTFLAVVTLTVGGLGWWTIQDALGVQAGTDQPPTGGATPAVAMDEPPVKVRSVAVLPLDDFSEEEGGEYFTAGLHEELISQLSQIGSARVVSRTSVVQYDATGKAMPAIAADLGVEGVVEGSVFRDGDRVRITVQLIHGPTDQHLWANSYDGTLEDAIGLQRTVAQAIAQEIQAELFPNEMLATPETRVAASPRVQEEYLKGRYDWSKATPEALESAIGHFEAAIQEDSGFAPAYAGLAGARFLLGVQDGDSVAPGVLIGPEIVEPLEYALRLDEGSPEAQAVMFSLQEALGDAGLPEGFQIFGDSAAFLEAEVALTSTGFGHQLHKIIVQKGPEARVVSDVSEAQKLAHARRLQATSDFKTAEEVVWEAIHAAPESGKAWDALEQLRSRQGDFEGAAQARGERLARGSGGPEAEASLQKLQEKLSEGGERGYWSWQVEELLGRREAGEDVSPVRLARAYVGLGRLDEALNELEAALKVKDRNLISLWSAPAWDSLRGDPRFRQILTKARRSGREDGIIPGSGF